MSFIRRAPERPSALLMVCLERRGRTAEGWTAELGVTFSRSCNYLIQTLDSQLVLNGLKTCLLINHDRKLNVLLYFEHLKESNIKHPLMTSLTSFSPLESQTPDTEMHSNFAENNLRLCWDVRLVRWRAEEREALKNTREMMKARGRTATRPLTDQPHEVSQTNGAENRRIMSLLSLH